MKRLSLKIFSKIIPLFIVFVPVLARAQYVNPISFGTIPEFIEALLIFLVTIGTLVLVVMVVYAGFMFITAQGQPEKLKTAKSAFFWVVIGGALVLGAWALSLVVKETIEDL